MRQVRLLKQHKREQARKGRILAKVRRFVDQARALGVEGDRWSYYGVNIDEPVLFPESGKILSQTVNTGSYYFKPVALHIKKILDPETGTGMPKPSSVSADSRETKEGDISLSLRGTFVVRQR